MLYLVAFVIYLLKLIVQLKKSRNDKDNMKI